MSTNGDAILIIGSGIAGMSLALKLAEHHEVNLVTKGELYSGASPWAQGGIASVFHQTDTFEKHAEDTISAGAGLCHEDIVDMVVRSGPHLVQELIEMGVSFTKRSEFDDLRKTELHLTQEGGHSARRVVHANDITGAEIMSVLSERVKAHPQINLKENHFAVDLITSDKINPNFRSNSCMGAYVYDRNQKEVKVFRARRTFLCTGGHGRIYLYTSNPSGATGDGLSMAWRAGCKIANLEFMQFHPTCLYHEKAKNFLISEALRGEGALITNIEGEEFVKADHPSGSLAPRDVVSRSIAKELDKTGAPHVFLDARPIGVENIKRLFPNIYSKCQEFGIDITREPIPVIPAAHYSCGGVVTDENARTNIKGLYALGEVACTGLHGANRLASNSLLEGLVFADRAYRDAIDSDFESELTDDVIPLWQKGDVLEVDELGILYCAWDEIRRLMWHYVGIIRSETRLKRAFDRISRIRQEIDDYYWKYEVSEELFEVRNLCHTALLTIKCARGRKESRGIHYLVDHPTQRDTFFGQSRDTVLW